MQRSRNSSLIPMPKYRRSSSSESLRNSQIKPALKRSNSFSQPTISYPHPSRSSIRPTDSNRDYGGSNPNLLSASKLHSYYKRDTTTPLRTGLGNASRRITSTPLHGVGRLVSPAQTLTSQKINDKKFSHDQFRKTCNFLEDRIDDFDPKLLKTLTLATFVNVVTLLFNEIDPRIKMNMENYKETVFKYMKLYKYPGPVSISMLKSANTPLSWSAIMAMFGWLIDLIQHSNGEEFEDDKLRKYISVGSMGKFKGIKTKNLYVNYIDEVLGLDRHEFNVLSSECEKFQVEVNRERRLVEELQTKEKNLSDELQRMHSEMKEFKEGNLETKLKAEVCHLKAEYEKRELKIEEMKSSLVKTREIISSQKYSLRDKYDVAKKLEDLHYSLDMKKEKLESIKKLKDEYDYKQTNLRRQIEAEVYEINERLLQLQLLNADARNMQLPDRGFHSQQFLETVEKNKQLLQSFKETVELELAASKTSLNAHENEFEVVSNGVSENEKEIALLESELDRISVESERVIFESDITKQQLEKKKAALEETTPDLESLKKRKNELHKKLLRLDEEIEKLSKQSIEFFKELHKDAVVSGTAMRNMMATIYEKCYEAFQHCVLKMEAPADALSNATCLRDGEENS